jgi:hypothetical protein
MSHKIFRFYFVLILVIGLVSVTTPQPAYAAGPWYVATTGDDNNDCLSPATSCATINGAIGKASSGDTIYVAEGTYTGSSSEVILIDKNITLSGGWDSGFSTQSSFSTIDGQNARRGVFVANGVIAGLDRFIVRNGSVLNYGGGIYSDGDLSISNSSIHSNSIANYCYGGGIFFNGTSLSIENSTVSNNTAGCNGGGVFSAQQSSTVNINNSTISNNNGGGLFNNGTFNLNNTIVSGNETEDCNGTPYTSQGNNIISNTTNCTITATNGDQFDVNPLLGSFLADRGYSPLLLNSPAIDAGNDSTCMSVDQRGVARPQGASCDIGAYERSTAPSGPAVGISLGTGNNQRTPLLTAFPVALQVATLDAQGNPVSGVAIEFSAPASGPSGTFADTGTSTASVNTDADGYATTIFTANDQAGSYTVSASATALGTVSFNLEQFVAPANDNFANAESITSLPFSATVDNTEASTEPGEPQDCSFPFKSVWYTLSPAENMAVRVDMAGSSVGGAVSIFLASGPTFSDLTSLGCTYSGSGNSTNFQLEAGKTYYLRVDGNGGQAGVLQINLQQITPPANDNFANAEVITSLPFSATVDNTNATAESGEPQMSCGFPFRSVWYSFTPIETMAVRVDMLGSQVGGIAGIYLASGPGISNLTLLTCAFSNNPSNFNVEAGQTYYLRVDGNGGQTGVLQVNLQQITPPANDNFANAEVMGSLPFSATVDNTDATNELDEPHDCSFAFRTLWYSFSPAENMTVRVDMPANPVQGTFSMFLASGPAISDLTFLGCSYSGSSGNFQLEAGKTYYLRVDTFGQPGLIQVNLQQITPPANDNFANAEVIGSLPFSATVDNTDATAESGEPQMSCGFPFRSVWYSFTPIETMAVRVGLAGNQGAGTFNILLASGPTISDLTSLACSSSGSSTNIEFEAGKTYYLRLDSSGQPGVFQVSLEQITPPANDNFANAEVTTAPPFSLTMDNTDATVEPGEPQGCGFPFRSLWYSFIATETSEVRMNTFGSTAPANVSIYLASGSTISDLTFLTCTTGTNSTRLTIEAGNTYYLRVDSYGQAGAIQINMQPSAPPANDNFASAESISSLPFHTTVDITDATNEANEPQGCNFMPNTIWYSFTPTEAIKLKVDTSSSPISANVNLYRATGNGFPGLQFIQCSGFGGTTTLLAEAGATYYFQVGGFGQAGAIQLNVSEMAAISGRVTDAVTGAPLPGIIEPYATAHLYRICGDGCLEFVNSQNADGEGRFVFDSYDYGSPLPDGSYQITVTALLYQTQQFGPFELSGSNLDVGDLPLNPPSVIRGRVVASDTGSPLPDASVTLFRCNESGCSEYVNSQNTDSAGQFRINSFSYDAPLPGGTYELEISATLYETRRLRVTISDSENRDLGDVLLQPFPLIGSISGRLLDAVTAKPISQSFGPSLILYHCEGEACSFVNSMVPDPDGRFRFDTDYAGNRLITGSYRIYAAADQYDPAQINTLDVVENENRSVGDIRLNSLPVRFSELQSCGGIPASGGECLFTVKISNGTSKTLTGKVWSLANSTLPDSFAGYTNFQIKDPQDLDLGKGKSKVFSFRFNVPANMSTYGSFVCTRLFVGQGSQALFNTIGVRDLFCVYRNTGGFAIVSPQEALSSAQTNVTAAVTGTEIEPNDSCQTAQEVSAISSQFIMDGNLDSSVAPDVDFFRFSGSPGRQMIIDLEGQSTGKGTLSDPFLGSFDSNCNLIALNDDSGTLNSHLEITIPADGIFILAATTCCDSSFNGGGTGSYQLTVAPLQYISSISGVVTDALNGKPLRGDAAPFASVYLRRCDTFGCNDVNFQNAGSDGSFHFNTDSNGNALRVGDYRIVAQADQYQMTETEMFSVGEGEDHNTGLIALNSYPIRFSDTQVCTVPAQGGLCDFTVKITNGLSTKFSGKAWSIIDGNNIGSLIGFTSFQTDSPLDVSLASGKSTVLRFRFQVRGSVSNGANICATIFAGQNPSPFFNTVGQRNLFCFTKGTNGFTLMSEQEMQSQLQHMLLDEIAPKNKPFPKK